MIFYFSGSGNSYAIAKKIADATNDTLVNIADAMYHQKFAYTLQTGEKLGFVFPVYTWAPPKIVEQFIQHLELYHDKQTYIYAVCTCGKSIGETMYIFDAALQANGLKLCSGFSVVMPDNYAVLFKAPSLQEQQRILSQADTVIVWVIRSILLERRNFYRITKGKHSRLLSNVVNPLFLRFATKTKPFYATKDCVGCGICEKVCNAHCIAMRNNTPHWTNPKCHMCMACLQHCPTSAIQYGKKTIKKGRYLHPIYQKHKE